MTTTNNNNNNKTPKKQNHSQTAGFSAWSQEHLYSMIYFFQNLQTIQNPFHPTS